MFAIDSFGEITVADASGIDYESVTSFALTIEVSDGTSSVTQDVAIDVTDVNDVAPVVTAGQLFSIDEDASNGSSFGPVVGSDVDTVGSLQGWVIVSGNSDAIFAIDSASGQLKVADNTNLDYETTVSYALGIQVTDGVNASAVETVTVTIGNVNEGGVGPIGDSDGATDSVAEDATIGATVGLTAIAVDPDAGDTITYSLDDDAVGRFTIESSTGVVKVAAALDAESAASYTVVVRAVSSDSSFNTVTFVIAVADVDEFDVGPIADADAASEMVLENALTGTAVGIAASASDADASNNAIVYSLDDDAGGRFAIDGASGVVTVANGALLDRETAASHDITVLASSADGSTRTRVFTVAIGDVDEFAVSVPVDVDAGVDAVSENVANGSLVGVAALGTDADATNNAITYSLDDDAGGRFTIDTVSGVVTVADGSLLDRETAASHDILVRADSSDGSSSVALFTIVIDDADEYDVSAVTDSDATADGVSENAAIGTLAGVTAYASDADSTSNQITYVLDNDAGGRFAIDGLTGIVTLAGPLDYETAISHDIVVRATSADGSYETRLFTIAVSNVSDVPVGTLSDVDVTSNQVAENSAVGTTVGVVARATDPETADTVSYSLDDDAGGQFAIDPLTGVVSVAGALDHESAASHAVVVRATSSDASFSTGTFTVLVGDLNEAPSISAIADQAIVEDSTAGPLTFTISDPETAPGSLIVAATSSNAALIPNANLVLGGSGATRTITVTPAANAAGGPVTITLSVSDGVNLIQQTFTVSIAPVADTPTVAGTTTDEDTQSATGLVISRNLADGASVTHFKITGIGGGTLYQNDGVTVIGNGAFITVAEATAGRSSRPPRTARPTAASTCRLPSRPATPAWAAPSRPRSLPSTRSTTPLCSRLPRAAPCRSTARSPSIARCCWRAIWRKPLLSSLTP